MTLQEIIDLARYSELSALSIKDDTEAVTSFINLGLTELYTKFDVRTEEKIIVLQDGVSVYDLPTDFLRLSSAWEEVTQGTLVGSVPLPINEENNPFSVNMISYNQVQVPLSTEGAVISLIYVPRPTKLTAADMSEEVLIPDQLITPLLNFVAFKGHAGIDTGVQTEDSVHYARFENSCDRIQSLGFGVASDDLNMNEKFINNGWV